MSKEDFIESFLNLYDKKQIVQSKSNGTDSWPEFVDCYMHNIVLSGGEISIGKTYHINAKNIEIVRDEQNIPTLQISEKGSSYFIDYWGKLDVSREFVVKSSDIAQILRKSNSRSRFIAPQTAKTLNTIFKDKQYTPQTLKEAIENAEKAISEDRNYK